MKALLKKDIYVLTRQMKFFLVVIAAFCIVPGINLSAFAIAYCGMLPYTAMAYDERSKWPELAAMMPYSSAALVLSKYALGWLAILAGGALTITAQLLTAVLLPERFTFFPAAVPLSLSIGFLVVALTLPPMFRFGVERGRMVLVLAVVALACGGAGFVQGAAEAGIASISKAFVLVGFPLLALVLSAVSVPLSIALFERKMRS